MAENPIPRGSFQKQLKETARLHVGRVYPGVRACYTTQQRMTTLSWPFQRHAVIFGRLVDGAAPSIVPIFNGRQSGRRFSFKEIVKVKLYKLCKKQPRKLTKSCSIGCFLPHVYRFIRRAEEIPLLTLVRMPSGNSIGRSTLGNASVLKRILAATDPCSKGLSNPKQRGIAGEIYRKVRPLR
jgi:hypothetical protein